ncbi:MAG: hypothetical protein WAL32_06135 [Terriglobales bacterium]
MRSYFYRFAFLTLIFGAPAWATVNVTSPLNGSTGASPVHYVATASTSTCNKGVASMGIYIDDVLTYVTQGASLNTNLAFSPGSYNTVVEEWDYCGGATYTPVAITVTGQTGVWVTSPKNNSTVGSPVNYVATASTSTCNKGVASMGIYINNVLTYVTQGASLNTYLSFNDGTYNTVVEEWDYCGGASYTSIKITVNGSGGQGSTLSNLQSSGGWVAYGEYPPDYNICQECGSGVTWSMVQHIKSPSMSGNSTEFSIGGTTPYSDVLFTNPLIGQNSTQGLPDNNHTLLPTLHNFTYDAYFYAGDISLSQVLEFDISMYFNSLSLIWGTQCEIAGGHEWDIWNSAASKWESTGVACNPINAGWNHLTIQVQRESNNSLLFESITLNGNKAVLNKTYSPGKAPSGWWGITVNYQLDGNSKQSAYSTYLDNFNFTFY